MIEPKRRPASLSASAMPPGCFNHPFTHSSFAPYLAMARQQKVLDDRAPKNASGITCNGFILTLASII